MKISDIGVGDTLLVNINGKLNVVKIERLEGYGYELSNYNGMYLRTDRNSIDWIRGYYEGPDEEDVGFAIMKIKDEDIIQ